MQTNNFTFKNWEGFTYKLVIQDSSGGKVIHTNQSFKIEKVQRNYRQTSYLGLKRWKGFPCKLVT